MVEIYAQAKATKHTKAHGTMTLCMAMVFILIHRGQFTLEIGISGNTTVKENTYFQMDAYIKDNGINTRCMAKENFRIKASLGKEYL